MKPRNPVSQALSETQPSTIRDHFSEMRRGVKLNYFGMTDDALVFNARSGFFSWFRVAPGCLAACRNF
jgi:hypothetical protein